MPTLPIQFGSPTPVILTDVSGSSGTSANLPVVDAATGTVNTAAPVYAEQIGWLDAGGKLQAVSAANPLPISGGGSGSNAAAGPTGSAVPADADYQGVSVGGTLTGVTGLSVGGKVAPTIAIVDGSGNQVTSFGGAATTVASNYHLVSAGSNNANNIKNAAGTLFGIRIFNNAAYPVYVKLFNKASSPSPGSDTPFKTIGVQAGTERDVVIGAGGQAMGTGIGIAIVKGIADADNTAVLANDCVVDVEYT